MAQATIYYLNGRQLIGHVAAWKPNAGRVELNEPETGKSIALEWPLIAHIDRSLHYHQFTTQGVLQNYFIELVNQQNLSGAMVSAAVTPHGVEVWHLSGPERVIERFAPWQAIKSYKIGDVAAPSAEEPVSKPSPDHNQPPASDDNLSREALEVMEVRSASELESALDRSKALVQVGYDRTLRKTIGDILVQSGVLNSEQLNVALGRKRTTPAIPIGEILVELGSVSEEAVQRALAFKLGVPFVRLDKFEVDPKALKFVPPATAARLGVLPLIFHERHLVVALNNPSDTESLGVLNFLAGYPVKYALASREELQRGIDRYYGAVESQEAAEEVELLRNEEFASVPDRQEIEKLGQERPVIRFVNSLILDAIRKNASDIHLSPREDYVQLLYRMNGDMIPIKRFNKGLLAAAVSRIKIIGGMDITERRVPQDGRASVRQQDANVDLRISIMPTVSGESVVIRILNTNQGLKSIDTLGFNDDDKNRFTDLIHRNQGMLLITGPTGSGKSTTLYAALNAVNSQSLNILTVEDPVEYHIDGIEQMQVNEPAGFTFPKALRNILRHDPDIIMVGEIRDQETGRIAVQSALTGHLVLSTLHTNSAASTVMRMIDMGIEDYLISGTLIGVLAQRLVRQNCTQCVKEEAPDDWIRQSLEVDKQEVFYRSTGCDSCHQTGFSGRLAVYELLVMNTELRSMINGGTSADVLETQAIKSGMTPLTKNALAKAREGVISLSEVYRIRLA